MVTLLRLLLACGSYGLDNTVLRAEGVVDVETEPRGGLTFDTVVADGLAIGRADLTLFNVGQEAVEITAVDVSTTAPATGADVFRTVSENQDEPLPVPRTLKPSERFPLHLIFRPDSAVLYQGRVLVRFAGDAIVESALFGEGCVPDESGCP